MQSLLVEEVVMEEGLEEDLVVGVEGGRKQVEV